MEVPGSTHKLHALLTAIPTLTTDDLAVLVEKVELQQEAVGGKASWRATEARVHTELDRTVAKQRHFQQYIDALNTVARSCTKAGITGSESEPILNSARAILGLGRIRDEDANWLNAPFCEMWLERRPDQPEPLAV
jgi:hypothetical protein